MRATGVPPNASKPRSTKCQTLATRSHGSRRSPGVEPVRRSPGHRSMLASLLFADADAPTPPAVAPRVPHPRPASIGIGEPALANAQGLGVPIGYALVGKNRCSKGG